MDEKNNKKQIYDAWNNHWEEQILFIANNTTPDQRVQWVEDMILLFGDRMPRRDTIPEWWNSKK